MSTAKEYFEATIQSVTQKFRSSRKGKKRRGPVKATVLRKAFLERLEERQLLTLIAPVLHSDLGASHEMYLDFVGSPAFTFVNGSGTYTAHGAGSNSTPIPAFTMDGDANNFSALELTTIQNIWAVVAEKYSPFDIDVTTVFPGSLQHGVDDEVIFGGSVNDWFQQPAGGVSAIGGFNNPSLSLASFSWTGDLNWSSPGNIQFSTIFAGVTGAHEAGHTFGLSHQRSPGIEYYNGDASESPIMGNAANITGNNRNIRGIWWVTNMEPGQQSTDPIQNDLAVISGVLGYRSNQAPETMMSNPFAGDITGYGGTIIQAGVLNYDQFQFQATGPTASFTINNAPFGGMLAPHAVITTLSGASTWMNSDGSAGAIDTSTDTNTSCTITASNLVPGQSYDLLVGGQLISQNTISTYQPVSLGGDIGQFTISGTLPPFVFMSGQTLEVVGFGNYDNNLSLSLSNNTYTVTDSLFGGTVTRNFPAFGVDAININLGSGANTLSFGGGNLTGIADTQIDLGSGNSNTLNIDDSQYTGSTTYTVNGAPPGFFSTTSRPGGANISYSDYKTVSLIAGTGQNSIDVSSTNSGTFNYINTSGGEDFVNVGLEAAYANIGGRLYINSGGDGSINVDDSIDPIAQSVVLAGASTPGWGAIKGLGAEIDYSYAGADQGIGISLGIAANAVNVNNTGTQTTFTGGRAKSFYMLPGASATLSAVTISGGNGITNYGNLTIANSIISDDNNGGILNFSGSVYMTGSRVTGNTASGNGGGINNVAGGTLILIDSEISENHAGGQGGGVFNGPGSSLTINNCTFSGNSASGGGGGLYNSFKAFVTNSILWGDLGGEFVNQGSILSVQFSDVQGGYTGTTGATTGDINPPADPMFASSTILQILSNSPAINTGSNQDVTLGLKDVLGRTRVAGGTVDMGAYEFQGPFPPPTLVFAPGPSTVNVGNAFGPAVAVNLELNNEVETGDTATVTLSIASGPSATFANGNSSITVSAVGGTAMFGSNVTFNVPGLYVLGAADADEAATPTLSGQFNVNNPGAVPNLVFAVQPSNVTSGIAMSPPVEVDEYLNGVLDKADSTSVMTLSVGGSPVNTTLVTQGVAIFSNLILTNPGSTNLTETLVASDGTDNPNPSNSFTLFPAPPPIPTLAFGAQPVNPIAGSQLNPAITVTQKEFNGNGVGDSSFVTLSVSGGTLNGSLIAQVSNAGVATFTGLSPNATGTYTLTAHDGNDSVGTLSFTVAPTHLVFTLNANPNFTAGQGVHVPTFSVSVYQNGLPINDSSNITVSLLLPGGGSYGGTTQVAPPAGSGTATFSNFFIGSLPETYNVILQATDANPNIASGESNSFSVTPAAPHTLGVLGGGATAAIGTSISPGFQFQVFDFFNDRIFNDNSSVTASIFSGPGGTLSGTTTAPLSQGFSNLVINNIAGNYVLQFTDAAEGLSVTTPVTITGGPATHLVFLQQPSTTSTSYPIQPPIVVEAEDAFNNPASSYSGMVTLSIASGPGSLLNGVVTVPAQNGLATFGGVSIGQLGTYMLSAVDSVAASITGTSNSFSIVAPATLYVDKNAAGGNGTSWALAFNNLQSALNAAAPGDTIDVAQGDYSPGLTPGSNPTDTFQLEDGVTIQGGFQTGGLNGPNPTAYPTVLDGLGVDYHVVSANTANSTAVLEGVTIKNGNANGNGDADSGFGGGLIADGGSPTISNCIFTNNSAVSGGAMYLANDGSVPATVSNCTFSQNTATTSGGAIYNLFASPTIIDCRFLANSSLYDGAIDDQNSNAILVNDLFAGNTAASHAGAIFNDFSSPTLTNCTFTGNTAANFGGAMENDDASMPTVTNCIFWNNVAPAAGNDISDNQVSFGGASVPVINHSDGNFSGLFYTGGVGNIDADPQFVNSAGGNYQLQETSPAINVGDDNAPALAGVGTDLAGNPRVIDSVVDIGAYEAQLVGVTWTGLDDGINWSDPGNWSDKLVPTQFDDATVGSGFNTIQVGTGNYAVHTLAASSPIEITTGALVLYGQTAFSDGLTIDAAGTLTVIPSDPIVVTATGLTINPGGIFNLNNNELLINYAGSADPISAIASYLASGYSGGAWTGNGIDSSRAAAHPGYALGYVDGADKVPGATVASGQIEIAYTLYGDLNLDHLVNATDFAVFGTHFNTVATAWDQGDFTYDNLVNASDFALLGTNFGQAANLGAVALVSPSALPATAVNVQVTPALTTAAPAISKVSSTKPKAVSATRAPKTALVAPATSTALAAATTNLTSALKLKTAAGSVTSKVLSKSPTAAGANGKAAPLSRNAKSTQKHSG